MWAWRVLIAVSVATSGHPGVPPQVPYIQYGTAAHGELGGRGAVVPVTPGFDFQPDSELPSRHAGTLRKSHRRRGCGMPPGGAASIAVRQCVWPSGGSGGKIPLPWGARRWSAENLELSTRRSHTLSPADLQVSALERKAGALRFSVESKT